MSDRPIRLAFAIDQFEQGGSQRYLFEVCRALDKERFDVCVLTRARVDRRGYYYAPLRAAGIPIHEIRPHIPDPVRFVPAIVGFRPYRVAVHRTNSMLARWTIGTFLNAFDLVACIQIETYYALQSALAIKDNAIVHLMSNRFQYAYDPYDECRTDQPYRFVTFDSSQTEEVRASRCHAGSVFEWPLSMDLTGFPLLPIQAEPGRPKKIGIFTRLSREKPIEKLFECFAGLVREVDATLHVYGNGDPGIFRESIHALGIADRVVFEGHAPDMNATLRTAGLSMCWLISVGTLLGFATIEIAACGMPMAFWNFGARTHSDILRQTGGAVHSFDSVPEFVRFAVGCLNDPQELAEAGATLRRHILSRHDIHRNIKTLQDYYEDVARSSRVRTGPSRS